jgi:hypothetical protein
MESMGEKGEKAMGHRKSELTASGSQLKSLEAGTAIEKCHADGATRTSAFPKLRPCSIPMKAAGAFSRPSVMSSR